MAACNLSTLPLGHSHVAALAAGLPNLRMLDLAGCQKLQPGVVALLLSGCQRAASLQVLNLQRCFQLTDASLSDMLLLSREPTAELQCAALSHLTLTSWPPAAPVARAGGANTTYGSAAATAAGAVTAATAANQPSAGGWASLQRAAAAALLRLPPGLDAATAAAPAAAPLPVYPLATPPPGGGLRILALSNCVGLSAEGLLLLAGAAPRLQYLLLGGCVLRPGSSSSSDAGDGGPGSSAAADACMPGGALPPALQQLAMTLQLPDMLPWSQLQGCGCSTAAAAAAAGAHDEAPTTTTCHPSSSTPARRQLQRAEPSPAALCRAREAGLALTYAAALLPELRAIEVTSLAPGVAGWLRTSLSRLHDLRTTSSTTSSTISSTTSSIISSTTSSLNTTMTVSAGADIHHARCAPSTLSYCCCCCCCRCGDGNHGGNSGSGFDRGRCTRTYTTPRVWDLACVCAAEDTLVELDMSECAAVKEAAVAAAPSNSSGSCCPGGSGGSRYCTTSETRQPPNHTPFQVARSALQTVLRCAANCSNRGRATPLHIAAERGCARHVRALLRTGAAVSARDASGATPLFVAAEAGAVAAAAALLRAGGDPLLPNTAGETPLYIASLRGHLDVVQQLLGALCLARVDWLGAGLYGDGWSPLHAAAVANRVDVARALLRAAAGGSCCGTTHAGGFKQQQLGGTTVSAPVAAVTSPPTAGVRRLLAAENRYGQTALHIAARKGCRELLVALLAHGAAAVSGGVMDAAGDTPLMVAARHGHDRALRELLACNATAVQRC